MTPGTAQAVPVAIDDDRSETTGQYLAITKSLRGHGSRHETQERLVMLLLGGHMCTSELLAALQISEGALSHALGRMRAAGWSLEREYITSGELLWSLRLPKRTCIAAGCTTRLSRFNAGLHCHVHGGGWFEDPPAAEGDGV